ncbi:hypothetical protein AVEN_251101-1 [Araneus ventricosus]|uniref:Uncharacterized protein n=1 Tax=Araneus ventricosus TaxID=182803 RepID=A0A4Y2T7Y9_ARAVE|nr:hypothetical protein AVEN_251101-1 [Araneus ventricosus]
MAEALTYFTTWDWYFVDILSGVVRSYNDLESTSDKTDGIIDITVSNNDTCQKRGHTSLYVIIIDVDIFTGFVIDYEMLSKYCPECTTAKRILENTVLISPYGTKPTARLQRKLCFVIKCYGS